jgi:lactate dehydrogenase-like 2-hydroxyacid dehydrogenase
MKIVFLDFKTIGQVPNQNILDSLGDVTTYQTTSPNQTAERIKGADIVITNKVVLDGDIIRQAEQLKLICVAATGMNNIDLSAAEEEGIPVKNVEDYASKSVAQGTFALILHLLYNLPYYDEYVKSGSYSGSDIFTNVEQEYREISGKRFGIIGLGNIGSQVARIADAFGAEVVYYSTSGRNTDQPYRRLELEEFLQTSDIISIHAPLNENTANLIDYRRLELMKPSALLINTGRGGIVNETDLARALDEDLIAGAAIDVFGQEPIGRQNPLMKVKKKEKLILTPHMTWASIEARTSLVEGVRQNIEEFLKDD